MNATTDAKITRRKFVLGGTFAAVTALAAARQPSKRVDYLGKSKLEKLLPQQLGQWSYVSSSGLVVPPEDQLSRALYSQLLTRVYRGPGDSGIMLLIAQSCEPDRHPPDPSSRNLLYGGRIPAVGGRTPPGAASKSDCSRRQPIGDERHSN